MYGTEPGTTDRLSLSESTWDTRIKMIGRTTEWDDRNRPPACYYGVRTQGGSGTELLLAY